MKFEFSDKIKGLKPSVIREILKNMADPTIISFAGGSPAVESFPIEAISRYSNELLSKEPLSVLQYSITEGYPPLRESAAEFANSTWVIKKETDDLIITSGSQQILDFTAKCLCNEGDLVVSEEFAFLGALNAFKSYGAKLVSVTNDATGSVDITMLEQIFSAEQKPKFFYVIPNFQNPTGRTMPLEKRKAVYELSVKYGVPILEDDPYGQIRFNGQDVPPIKTFDTEGAVIYAGSLSKIMCPGFRVAYAIGAKEILSQMVIAKQGCDVHSNIWAQRVCHEILTKEDMVKHISKLQVIYKQKSDLMVSEMEKCFSDKVTYDKPDGGMFIWVTMPKGVDVLAFIQEAMTQKVALVPGVAFATDENVACQSFRMNFSTPSNENIVKGVGILGELTKKYCD